MARSWREWGGAETERYADRRHAGEVLAQRLADLKGRDDVLVLGLPRGGVVVAYEVACELGAPLDVLVVRKIGAPGREELAIGALATGDVLVFDERLARQFGVDERELAALKERARRELERRERLYRGDRPPLDVRDKVVVLVDDGLATGSTMRAAVASLRARSPRRVVVAVPVGPPPVCAALGDEADEVICVLEPPAMYAVGSWYGDFTQTSDEEVGRLLEAACRDRPQSQAAAGPASAAGTDPTAGSAGTAAEASGASAGNPAEASPGIPGDDYPDDV